MLWHFYNNIIILTNVIILEFLSAWFVHPGALLQSYLFLTQVRATVFVDKPEIYLLLTYLPTYLPTYLLTYLLNYYKNNKS